ncbi:MAG: hypothetical protein R3D62_01855 [Xanthobacteraceae bacterium]
MRSIIETAGYGSFGPFRDEVIAADWACKNVRGATWRLVKLREPAGLTHEEMGDVAAESGRGLTEGL